MQKITSWSDGLLNEKGVKEMGDFFSVKKSGDISIMNILKEEITMHEIEAVKKEFSDEIDKGTKNLLVSLKKMQFISSLVLAAMVFVHKKIGDNKGKLKFCELQEKVKEVFKITDLDKVFDIYPTESDALAKFAEEGLKIQ